jgi:Flp pilus assembly pilin Flp
MKTAIKKSLSTKKELGATMLEYALLAALIAAVCLMSIGVLGRETSESFTHVAAGFPGASS